MPRTAILLTLIVVTFFGPLLCCCALGVTCPTRGVATAEPDEVAACPHCQKTEPTKSEPAKSKHDCPACEKRKSDTTYVEAKPAPLPAGPTFVAWIPFDTLLTARPAATQPVDVPPLPDPQTFLLDSCHRLRC
jgi:hypothetical protein